MARLDRILDVAEESGNTTLQARAQAAIAKENERHARAMEMIRLGAGQ